MSGCWCGSSGCAFHELDIDTEEEKGPSLNADHAAGRAVERDDVVAWLRSYAAPHWPSVDVSPALQQIKSGAHVGAAKKGAT